MNGVVTLQTKVHQVVHAKSYIWVRDVIRREVDNVMAYVSLPAALFTDKEY